MVNTDTVATPAERPSRSAACEIRTTVLPANTQKPEPSVTRADGGRPASKSAAAAPLAAIDARSAATNRARAALRANDARLCAIAMARTSDPANPAAPTEPNASSAATGWPGNSLFGATASHGAKASATSAIPPTPASKAKASVFARRDSPESVAGAFSAAILPAADRRSPRRVADAPPRRSAH